MEPAGQPAGFRPAAHVEVERVGSGLPDGDHQVLVTGRVLPCLFEGAGHIAGWQRQAAGDPGRDRHVAFVRRVQHERRVSRQRPSGAHHGRQDVRFGNGLGTGGYGDRYEVPPRSERRGRRQGHRCRVGAPGRQVDGSGTGRRRHASRHAHLPLHIDRRFWQAVQGQRHLSRAARRSGQLGRRYALGGPGGVRCGRLTDDRSVGSVRVDVQRGAAPLLGMRPGVLVQPLMVWPVGARQVGVAKHRLAIPVGGPDVVRARRSTALVRGDEVFDPGSRAGVDPRNVACRMERLGPPAEEVHHRAAAAAAGFVALHVEVDRRTFPEPGFLCQSDRAGSLGPSLGDGLRRIDDGDPRNGRAGGLPADPERHEPPALGGCVTHPGSGKVPVSARPVHPAQVGADHPVR